MSDVFPLLCNIGLSLEFRAEGAEFEILNIPRVG